MERLPPQDLTRAFELAERQLALGQVHGAIESLRRVLAMDPDMADAHAVLALALLRLKRLAAAEHESGMALTLEPESWLALWASGHVLKAQRRFGEAEERFETLRAHDPTSAQPLVALARLRQLQGRRAEAGPLLEKARRLDPEEPDVLAALGDWYLDKGRLDEAERLAHEALELEPEFGDALILMGSVHLRRGRLEAAREHAIWALRQDPSDESALHLLASVKARSSRLLGLWWRWSAWMGTLEDGHSILVLLGAFVLYRFGVITADFYQHENLASYLQVLWLGLVAYTWIGPGLFHRSLKQELAGVKLDEF